MKKILLSFASIALAMSAYAETTVYYTEDFEWIKPWAEAGYNGTPAGNTIESNGANDNAPNMTQCKVDDVTLYNAFLAKGYEFLATHSDQDKNGKTVSARTPDKQIYVQDCYLKFGLTNYFSGITFPAMENLGDGTTGIKVSFDWCPMKQGSGQWDTTILVIVVKNGEEELQFPVMPLEIAEGGDFKWYHTEVPLTDATLTKDTRLSIRNLDPQWPAQASKEDGNMVYRYFLDNVKVFSGEESAVAEIAVDENAPVEYFNLQGVRVNNPENGLYIVKQGNKVEKRIIR